DNVGQTSVYLQGPRPDVLLMGSSRILFGLHPEILQREIAASTGQTLEVQNLGFLGGGIDLNYLVLKNVIRDDKKPSLIVYGLVEAELLDFVTDAGRVRWQSTVERQNYSALVQRWDDMERYGGKTLEDRARFVLQRLIPIYRDAPLLRDAAT